MQNMPKKKRGYWKCRGCKEAKPHNYFTTCPQSYRGRKKGRCDMCLSSAKPCNKCGKQKFETDFTSFQWVSGRNIRKCRQCTTILHGYWTCNGCKKAKKHDSFTKCPRSYRGGKRGRCDTCMDEQEEEVRQLRKQDSPYIVRRSS